MLSNEGQPHECGREHSLRLASAEGPFFLVLGFAQDDTLT